MQYLNEHFNDDAASSAENTQDSNPPIGVDTNEQDLSSTPASTFPIAEDDQIGVDTNRGTDPASTDQADEEYDAKIWGTPDDPVPDSVYPIPDEDEEPSNHIIG